MSTDFTGQGLCCPYDHTALETADRGLVCAAGHWFPVIQGVPVLLRTDVEPTQTKAKNALYRATLLQHGASVRPGSAATEPSVACGDIHAHVQNAILGTCGNYYRGLSGRLTRYPIPTFPQRSTTGEWLLDLGCGWGRWSLAAAQAGFRVLGVDHDLERVLAAQQVAKQLNLNVTYAVADLRYLPLRARSVDVAFSYSVLQHFDDRNFDLAVGQIARMLKPNGRSLIQLPNPCGAASLFHQLARGFRPARDYEVRYRSPGPIRHVLASAIGDTSIFVDCFLGLNAQIADLDLMPFAHRCLIRASYVLTQLTRVVTPLKWLADSLYFESQLKPQSDLT